MIKKLVSLLLCSFLLILTGCQHKEAKNTIKVGTIAGPETALMEVAKKVALQRYGLHIDIVRFSDYNTPNAALSDGSIDANMFQHVPFLQQQIKARGYKLAVVGKTFVYPMAIYSKKIAHLAQLPAHSKVAIPNDPSNEARALLLLQKAGLITLKPHITVNATTLDIVKNPKDLQFVELGAAELPRALSDVEIATINTNYALPAGLSPKKNALFAEGDDSLYANVVVVRDDEKGEKKFKELVAALHSKAVLKKAKQLFGDGAIPAWKNT